MNRHVFHKPAKIAQDAPQSPARIKWPVFQTDAVAIGFCANASQLNRCFTRGASALKTRFFDLSSLRPVSGRHLSDGSRGGDWCGGAGLDNPFPA
jgi:hypothetical protein